MKSCQFELEQRLKGDSPGPEGREDAELADAKAEVAGPRFVAEADADRFHVGRLLADLNDFHQVGLVDVGGHGMSSERWEFVIRRVRPSDTSPTKFRRHRFWWVFAVTRPPYDLGPHLRSLGLHRPRDCCKHRADAESDGAIPRAVAAAGAEQRAELLRIDAKLVVNPLPLPLGLLAPRVVARGVQREHAELAGVPVPCPHALPAGPFVDDVETMAGRAGVGTGPAAETSPGQVRPLRVFEAAFQELRPPCPDRTDSRRPCGHRAPCGPTVRYARRTTAGPFPSSSGLPGSLRPARRAWRPSRAGRPGRNRPTCRSTGRQSSGRPG